jgi:hypothetical protein
LGRVVCGYRFYSNEILCLSLRIPGSSANGVPTSMVFCQTGHLREKMFSDPQPSELMTSRKVLVSTCEKDARFRCFNSYTRAQSTCPFIRIKNIPISSHSRDTMNMNAYARDNHFSLHWSRKDDWICRTCKSSNHVCSPTLKWLTLEHCICLCTFSFPSILGHHRDLLQMHQMDQSYDRWTSSLFKGSRFSSAERHWRLSTLQT